MAHLAFSKMAALAREPKALEATVSYLAGKLSFLKPNEKVLILFPGKDPERFGALMRRAVLQRGASPIMWEGDLRWKALLRLAFSSRASTIVGPPLVILGLSKLAKYNGTPLSIRNVVTAGYPCLDWMIDGIIRGLDCRIWGCFEPGGDAVVAGFSCGRSLGVHLRSEEYGAEIVDADGKPLPEGEVGEIILFPQKAPTLRCSVSDHARLETSPCLCGSAAPRLMDIRHGSDTDTEMTSLGQYLHSWSSVLACSVVRGEYGLELEMVIFPGEKLPVLPNCAKQIIRPWDPETDEPFLHVPKRTVPHF